MRDETIRGTIVAGDVITKTVTIKLDECECIGHVVLGRRVKISSCITEKMKKAVEDNEYKEYS